MLISDWSSDVCSSDLSSMIAQCIALMEMRVCGSPSYLARRGTPQTPNDLREHECLPYGHAPNVSWNFTQNGKPRAISVSGRLCANNGELLRDAACAGLGLTQLDRKSTRLNSSP